MSADSVNQHLLQMRIAGKLANVKEKGAAGELAALDIVHEYRAKHGGILKSGFIYPYASNRQSQIYLGNIFWDSEQQQYVDITRQFDDEIDILYISNCRVIPIEVKSYHDKNIVLTNQWMTRGGVKVEKSPLAQAEKHARHLYHQLYDVLPEGKPKYIQPLVCFVDSCTIHDERSAAMQDYMPVTILNNLKTTLYEVDVAQEYTLNLEMVERKLKAVEKAQ
jgi:hypothetical protein